jgi:hypothetical protein
MIDCSFRSANLATYYSSHKKLDNTCLSIEKLHRIFSLFGMEIVKNPEFAEVIRSFKGVTIEEPLSSSSIKILELISRQLEYIILQIQNDETAETVGKIARRVPVLHDFRIREAEKILAYHFQEPHILDGDNIIDDLERLKEKFSIHFAKDYFYRAVSLFSSIRLGKSTTLEFVNWLIESKAQFTGIDLQLVSTRARVPAEKLSLFINQQTALRELVLPYKVIERSYSFTIDNLKRLKAIDLTGLVIDSAESADQLNQIIRQLENCEMIVLPRLEHVEFIEEIKRCCSQLRSIVIREMSETIPAAFVSLLEEKATMIQEIHFHDDSQLNLRILPPSREVKTVRIIGCVLEEASTIFQIKALYPNLKVLDLSKSDIDPRVLFHFSGLHDDVEILGLRLLAVSSG